MLVCAAAICSMIVTGTLLAFWRSDASEKISIPHRQRNLLIRQLPDLRLQIASRINERSKKFTGIIASGRKRMPSPNRHSMR